MLQEVTRGDAIEEEDATNMLGKVYRKRRRMRQTRVGYIEKEEECYKHVG